MFLLFYCRVLYIFLYKVDIRNLKDLINSCGNEKKIFLFTEKKCE